jgi:hypothetical protein
MKVLLVSQHEGESNVENVRSCEVGELSDGVAHFYRRVSRMNRASISYVQYQYHAGTVRGLLFPLTSQLRRDSQQHHFLLY